MKCISPITEVIGALTSVLMIWVVTGVLVYLAVERLISGEYDINAEVRHNEMDKISRVSNKIKLLILHIAGHADHVGYRSRFQYCDGLHSSSTWPQVTYIYDRKCFDILFLIL